MARSEDRRRTLPAILRKAGGPVRGSDLAAELGVSRQVVVHDVALLRAEGVPIVGTPAGYLLLDRASGGGESVIAVRHDREGTRDELYVLVDHGITVVDVVVEHPMYGEMRGSLMLSTRDDVDRFLASLDEGGAQLLSALTGGVHLHTVRAPNPLVLAAAKRALREAGILLQGSG